MFLLDTNVLSELRKLRSTRTSQQFIQWATQTNLTQHFVSAASIMEIETGILRLQNKDPRQAWILRQWLTDFVFPKFRERILPITLEIAQRSAYLLSVKGEEIHADIFIAATAYTHNLTVVTRNTKDFKDTAVPLFNPWQA